MMNVIELRAQSLRNLIDAGGVFGQGTFPNNLTVEPIGIPYKGKIGSRVLNIRGFYTGILPAVPVPLTGVPGRHQWRRDWQRSRAGSVGMVASSQGARRAGLVLGSPGIYHHGRGDSRTGNVVAGTGGIPMLRDEVVASLMFGAMASFVFALVWGRQFVDLITAGF